MKNFLLDTHTFIWLTEDNSSLSDDLRLMIDNADLVYLSIASLWEIAIKLNLDKLSLQQDYETIGAAIEASDILMLPISFEDTVRVRHLPLHHRDPFDRILISQALQHDLTLVTVDGDILGYPIVKILT